MSTKLKKTFLHIETTSFSYEGGSGGTGTLIIQDIKDQETLFDVIGDQISNEVFLEKLIDRKTLPIIPKLIENYKNNAGEFVIGDIVTHTTGEAKQVAEVVNVISSFDGTFYLNNGTIANFIDLDIYDYKSILPALMKDVNVTSYADLLREVVKDLNNSNESDNQKKSLDLLIAEYTFRLQSIHF